MKDSPYVYGYIYLLTDILRTEAKRISPMTDQVQVRYRTFCQHIRHRTILLHRTVTKKFLFDQEGGDYGSNKTTVPYVRMVLYGTIQYRISNRRTEFSPLDGILSSANLCGQSEYPTMFAIQDTTLILRLQAANR